MLLPDSRRAAQKSQTEEGGREMLVKPAHDQRISPARLLEMLSDRFGAFEAIANSSIKLARVAPEEELAMEPLAGKGGPKS
jgi:hypothetical protein